MGNGNNGIQMTTSLIANIKHDNNIMVQSLDPTILSNSKIISSNSSVSSSLQQQHHDLSMRSSQSNMVASQFNGK